MKAWEIRSGELGLHNVPAPRPDIGEIVVRISYVGICGSDLPKLLRPNGFVLPELWRPGHEIVGIDPTGRTVAVDPLAPCGACARCAEDDTHLCTDLRRLGWDLPGGFAEQVAAPGTNTHPVPDGVDPLYAVLTDPAAVAIHGLRCNPIGSPRRLAVIGAGTVGLLTALYAHQHDWEVTIVHRDHRPPPPAVIDTMPFAFRVSSSLPDERTVDLVVDAASGADPTPLDLALRLVRDGGTIVVQNAYHPDVRLPMPLRDLFRRSIRLIGSFSYCRRAPGDFVLALDLLRHHAPTVAHLAAEAGDLSELLSVLADPTPQAGRQVLVAAKR